MSVIGRTLGATILARTVFGHPAVQVGLLVAPLLLAPAVRKKAVALAKDATLESAYLAGSAVRAVKGQLRSR